jgi:hypothetical protein
MRVLMLHNFYRQPGGEDACFSAEAEMLREYGNQVETVEMHNDETLGMSPPVLAAKTVWNRHSYTLVSQRIAAFKPDVMHCHNIFPLLSPSVYYAARRARVPVVQTLHNYRLLCLKATLFREGRVCESCVGQAIPWHGVARRCYHDSLAHSTSVASMLVLHRILGTWEHQVDLFLAVFCAYQVPGGWMRSKSRHSKTECISQGTRARSWGRRLRSCCRAVVRGERPCHGACGLEADTRQSTTPDRG